MNRLRHPLASLLGYLRSFRFETSFFQGREKKSKAPVSWICAGSQATRRHLSKMLAGDEVEERPLGRRWLWEVPALAREYDVHALVWEVSGERRRSFFRKASFHTPAWMRTKLDLSEGGRALKERDKFSLIRRAVARQKLTWMVRDDGADLDRFYDEIYVPHAMKRHSGRAILETRERMKEHFFSQPSETLYVVTPDGRTAGGIVVHYPGTEAHLHHMGVRDGDERLMKLGVMDALYYFALLRAIEKGCTAADLGHSRPILSDGVLFFKGRIGAHLEPVHHQYSGTLAFELRKDSPAVRSFLENNPLVIFEKGAYHWGIFSEATESAERSMKELSQGIGRSRALEVRVYSLPRQERLEISLDPPRVEGNRVHYSWSPNFGFRHAGYSVTYPQLERIEASPGKLAEGYLPVCLALSSLGKVDFRLPVRLDQKVLDTWKRVCWTAGRLFKDVPDPRFLNGDRDPEYRTCGDKTLLFFGGGTESLLTLGRLLDAGIRPALASFGGSSWPGSDPEQNPHKFEMDETVSTELGLEILKVRTDFRDAAYSEAWRRYLKPGVSMLNAVVALPSFISFTLPVVEELGYSFLVNGNEKMNYPDEYLCFSPAMTGDLATTAQGVEYRSELGELLKEEVCEVLYSRYPHLARYQYSCWRNKRMRWCYRCQSCLEYYMLLKNSGLDVATVGMDETCVRMSIGRLIGETACSAEARPAEIWPRLYNYPRLLQDEYLARVLARVRRQAKIYQAFPSILREGLGGLDNAVRQTVSSLNVVLLGAAEKKR